MVPITGQYEYILMRKDVPNMRKTGLRRAWIPVLLVLSMALAACATSTSQPAAGGGAAPQTIQISLYNGPPQGTWRPIAEALKKAIEDGVPGANVTIEAGGGAANVIAADSGDGDLAMVATSATYSGYLGQPPFEKKMENIREIAVIYPQPAQFYALKGSGIKTVNDLKGKRVGVQPKGYAAEAFNEAVLKAAGLSYEEIKPEFLGELDAANAVRDGHLDAVMGMGNVPYSVIVEMAAARNIEMVTIPDAVMDKMTTANKGLWRYTVPAGTYRGVDEPYVTLASGVHIVARHDLPDDLAEQVTRALLAALPTFQEQFASFKATTPEVMAQDVGIPFHPGAEKVYRSQGLLK